MGFIKIINIQIVGATAYEDGLANAAVIFSPSSDDCGDN
jgi:hypothetical protein